MSHSSLGMSNGKGKMESNERLEYLGDSILGMVVAEFLFTRYPYKDEGFLTEVRSKIVNRETMNKLSIKIGLRHLIQYHQSNYASSIKSIYGDTLEALIGAIYLDRGFKICKIFIIKKLLIPHFNFDELVNTTTNYKSKIIEWSQKSNKRITFKLLKNEGKTNGQFTVQVFINEEALEIGYGFSKKKAEQDAARRTYDVLEKNKQDSEPIT